MSIDYVVGLFEGEGSCGVGRYCWSRGKKRIRPAPDLTIKIGMTDREPLENVQSVMGGRIYGPYCKGRKKPMYHWNLSGRKNVDNFIERTLHLLSPRRQEQLLALYGEKVSQVTRR